MERSIGGHCCASASNERCHSEPKRSDAKNDRAFGKLPQDRPRTTDCRLLLAHLIVPKCGRNGQYTNTPRPTIFRCGTGPQSRLSELW